MTDVFISYKREERGAAERIASALIARGLNVWWDVDMLPGEAYRKRTLEVLSTCRAAVVVWSKQSTQSSWVLDEATRANDRGILVPVVIERLDEYPLGFGQLHSHTLIDWQGDPHDPRFEPVVAALTRLLLAGARPAEDSGPASSEAELLLWRGIQDSTRPQDFEAYLERYPSGVFALLARRRLADLSARPRWRAFGAGFLSARAGLSKWDFAFLGIVALVAPFVLWPIVNALIGAFGDYGVFYASDFARLFDLSQFANLFFMTPLLLAACWAVDTAEGWLDAVARQRRFQHTRLALHGVIGAALLIAIVFGLLSAIEDDGVRAHAYLWAFVEWLALLVTRRVSTRLRRLA